MKWQGPENPAGPDGATRHQFFFLLGHVRSGTNWTCNLLNLHPAICCHGEYHFEYLRQGVEKFSRGPNGLGYTDAEVREAVEDWFQDFIKWSLVHQASRKPGARWVGDRTPRALEVLLPGTPHIVVVRDGRDVIVSRAHHVLRLGGPWAESAKERMKADVEAFRDNPDYFRENPERLFADIPWLTGLAVNWAEWVKGFRTVTEGMQSGETETPLLVVKYEDLHRDPEGERCRMYEFFGLNPEDARPLEEGVRTTPGFDREDPHDFFRHGVAGDWKDYATDSFRRVFKEQAGQALIDLGYEEDNDW